MTITEEFSIARPFVAPEKSAKVIILRVLLSTNSVLSHEGEFLTPKGGSYEQISAETGYELDVVESVVNIFLTDLYYFNKFLRNGCIKWTSDLKKLNRKVRTYVHKIHRLAPVFDYERARTNVGILQQMLSSINLWPRITTQMALVLYYTELRSDKQVKTIQRNIRIMCNCSAYAFHETRNKLEEKYNVSKTEAK